jgi:hypothetical protein
MSRLRPALLLAAAAAAPVVLPACGVFKDVGLAPADLDHDAVKRGAGEREEPHHVVVRHVLIAFDETSVLGVTRTKAEAERLANQVLEMARAGRDFGELVRLYSDDRHGDGTYAIANWGVPAEADERPREGTYRGFARMAFSLEVGQVGFVPYSRTDAPSGWHVVLRTR